MDCEKCQELLSDYLDGALGQEEHSMLSAHFEECLSCFNACDDLNAIVSFCRDHRGEYEAPPNSHALWLRIRNTIEAEQQGRTLAATATGHVSRRAPRWWMRWMEHSWELSLSQMATAVAAIAVAVALTTAISLQRIQHNSPATPTETVKAAGSEMRPTTALLSNLQFRGISQEIDYWQQRVDERKGRWSQQRRLDFESNLKVIDQAVEERLRDLRENPHDEVTEEMLNAVLNNKMELLREFSDL